MYQEIVPLVSHAMLSCVFMWEFTEPNVNFVQISHKICTQFTSSSHSQANREDASLDPCEWKKNGDSEAIVHQGSVILICGTLGNIFVEFLGT